MKYKLVGGGPPRNTTGLHSNYNVHTKDGFQWWHETISHPLDAPDAIPCGAMHRIEWKHTLERDTVSWFPAELIILRG
jgi:hypothetical protein